MANRTPPKCGASVSYKCQIWGLESIPVQMLAGLLSGCLFRLSLGNAAQNRSNAIVPIWDIWLTECDYHKRDNDTTLRRGKLS